MQLPQCFCSAQMQNQFLLLARLFLSKMFNIPISKIIDDVISRILLQSACNRAFWIKVYCVGATWLSGIIVVWNCLMMICHFMFSGERRGDFETGEPSQVSVVQADSVPVPRLSCLGPPGAAHQWGPHDLPLGRRLLLHKAPGRGLKVLAGDIFGHLTPVFDNVTRRRRYSWRTSRFC